MLFIVLMKYCTWIYCTCVSVICSKVIWPGRKTVPQPVGVGPDSSVSPTRGQEGEQTVVGV